MRINTEDDGVFEAALSADEIRTLWDGPDGADLPEELTNVLDNAQGHVFSGQGDKAYIVITVTK